MLDRAKLESLKGKLKSAWAQDTSSDPQNWRAENPSWGQCAVTSCVVQDELGGDIVWAEAQLPTGEKISHYFNKVDGNELDLTRDQFPPGTKIAPGQPKTKQFDTTRDYVLSFGPTVERYNTLKKRLG